MPCLHNAMELVCSTCGASFCPICYPGVLCGLCDRPQAEKRTRNEAFPDRVRNRGSQERPPRKRVKRAPTEEVGTSGDVDDSTPEIPTFQNTMGSFARVLFEDGGTSDPLVGARQAYLRRLKRGKERRRLRSSGPTSVFDFLISRELGNEIRVRSCEHYGFIHKFETRADGWIVVYFECTTVEWMKKAWSELAAVGTARLLGELLLARGFRKEFVDAYERLGSDERAFLYALYLWFLNRILEEGDEAPCGFWEAAWPPQAIEQMGLRESEWYEMTLLTDGVGPTYPGEWTELAVDPGDDPEPQERWLMLSEFRHIPSVSEFDPGALNQEALKMLHFPRAAPETRGGLEAPEDDLSGDTWGQTPTYQGEQFFRGPHREDALLSTSLRGLLGRAGAGVRELLARASESVFRLGDSLRRVLDGGLQPAFAGIPAGLGATWQAPSAPPRPQPIAYVGGDGGAGPANAPQPANPMVAGPHPNDHQPFMGIVDIGQGNCNVLFDNRGKAIVYYDFGYRKVGKKPVRQIPRICLCDSPLIVLSHWDFDHVVLARYQPRSYGLTWIVPQQHMGTAEAREIVARILRGGGRLCLWEDRRGFMTFPWGFVVRSDRSRDPYGQLLGQFDDKVKNDTGLAVYVCVKDGAGTTAAANHANACPQVAVGGRNANTLAQYLEQRNETLEAGQLKKPLWQGEVLDRVNRAVAYAAQQHATAAVQAMSACLVAYLYKRELPLPNQVLLLRLAGATWAHCNSNSPRRDIVRALDNPIPSGLSEDVFDAAERLAEIADQEGEKASAAMTASHWLSRFNSVGQRLAVKDFPFIVARAGTSPAPPAPPDIQRVAAPNFPPFTAHERFILSTGDAAYQFVPTQRFAARPVVVGLAAFHHGANGADGQSVTSESIPLAFASRAARALAKASRANATSAVRAAIGAAIAVGDFVEVADAVRVFAAAREANYAERVAIVAAAVAVYQPLPGFAEIHAIVESAVALQNVVNVDADAVLDDAKLTSNPARLALAEAALAYLTEPDGDDALEVDDDALKPAVERALAATVPTAGGAAMAPEQIESSADEIVDQIRDYVNADVPNQAWICAALRAASGGVATAAQRRQFTAGVYAALASLSVEQDDLSVPQHYGLAREEDETRESLVCAAAAGGAVGGVLDADYKLHRAMTLAMLAATLSDEGLANAVRAEGAAESSGDRIAYTFGAENSYGHPMKAAIDKYVAHGWAVRLDRHKRNDEKDYDFAVGWEVDLGANYEGPLRGDNGAKYVDRTAGCNCGGVKKFRVR